jgi:hypothetical protein
LEQVTSMLRPKNELSTQSFVCDSSMIK